MCVNCASTVLRGFVTAKCHSTRPNLSRTLVEVVNYLQGKFEYQAPVLSVTDRLPSEKDGLDFFDVRGQEVLIEYIVAAVAGGHNILVL